MKVILTMGDKSDAVSRPRRDGRFAPAGGRLLSARRAPRQCGTAIELFNGRTIRRRTNRAESGLAIAQARRDCRARFKARGFDLGECHLDCLIAASASRYLLRPFRRSRNASRANAVQPQTGRISGSKMTAVGRASEAAGSW
jgi:hypothetical protein